MTEEEKPLFKPGSAMGGDTQFICNINGELSLWWIGGALRAYTGNSIGVWIDSEGSIDRQISIASSEYTQRMPSATSVARTIARNAEALRVYKDMLGERGHDR